jgi:hypothetical protein
MKTLARFVIRPAKGKRGDLILGLMFKDQSPELRPDRIYEIRDILGALTIVDVGESAIKTHGKNSVIQESWGWSVNDILNQSAGRFILTKAEVQREQDGNPHSETE